MEQLESLVDQLYLVGEQVYEHKEVLMRWEPMVATLAAYLVMVLVGPSLVGQKELVGKNTMRGLMFLHNAILCVLSLAMAVAALYGGAVVLYRTWGFEECLCNMDGKLLSGALWGWCWIFYASKYYELVDTLILILNRKKLIVLHVWHHLSVMVLCYLWIYCEVNFFFTGVVINGSIHVLMYSYYALSSIGYRAPWAKLITVGQMVQFAYGIASWWYWLYVCHADMTTLQWVVYGLNQFILASFLVLFKRFFNRRYESKPPVKDAQKKID